MNWYDGISIDRLWDGYSAFWRIPGTEGILFAQTWLQVVKKRGTLMAVWIFDAAIVTGIAVVV